MATRQPLPRSRLAAVAIGSTLVVWGGYGGSTKIKTRELAVFDVPSLTWEQDPLVVDGSDMPDGLYGMAVASDGETAYCCGGQTGSYPNCTYYNKLFQITPSRQMCHEVESISPSHTVPKKLSGSRLVQFGDKLLLFAGYNGQEPTNQLHAFDLKTGVWENKVTTGDKPPPLEGHTFTKIDHHRAVVFGGYTGSSRINDAYVLDIEKWHWRKVSSENKPPARWGHAACCIAGQGKTLLMVIEGWDVNYKILGDVWLLDVDKGVWRKVTLPVAITPRFGHSAVVFGSGASFRVVVFFGGYYNGKYLSETTLLLLVFLRLLQMESFGPEKAEFRGGSWQVTKVVKPDELARPDESLREQMRKLELSPHEVTATAAEQSLREEQERRAEAERQVKNRDSELQTQSTPTDGVASSTAQKDTSSPTHTGNERAEQKMTDSKAAITADTESTPQSGERAGSPATDGEAATTVQKDVTLKSTLDPADLKFSKERLGDGGQGTVWKGVWKGKAVAIKKCLQPNPTDVRILQQLEPHPNIITLHGFVVDMESMSCSIVMELVKGGALFDFLHKQKKIPTDDQKSSWMKGIAEGMLFLHSQGLAHRDLKSGNVLLAGDDLKTAKLCDFGTARKLDHTTAQTTVTGTYRWIAPEVIQEPDALINQKCDVFSYSMVLCEIVTQALPFKESKTDQLAMIALVNGKRPTLPSSDIECPPYLRNLITACWAENPRDRPSFQEINCILKDKQQPQRNNVSN